MAGPETRRAAAVIERAVPIVKNRAWTEDFRNRLRGMVVLCAFHVFMGVLVFAIPNLTRRELLFAVPVPPDFRKSHRGRHAISMFRATVAAIVLAGLCALLPSPAAFLNATRPLC